MFNSIFVIIGTFIGAGFSSGKEIFSFFNIYGIYGLCGLFISITFMGIILYKTLSIIIKYDISSYQYFINLILYKYPFLNFVFYNIVNIVLVISFVVMVSGFSAYFSQEFNMPHLLGAILICILSFFTFIKKIDGIIKVNKYFVPFLIVLIIILGFTNLNCFSNFNINLRKFNIHWIISSMLYASYNLLVIFPILINLKKYINDLKEAKIVTCVVSMFLFLLSLILFLLLNSYFSEIENVDLPTIYISSKLGFLAQSIFGIAILGAIFTTAISSGYGFLSNLNTSNKPLTVFILILLYLISILACNLGFSRLLNMLYPVLGIIRINTNYFYFIFYKKILIILNFTDINI